MSRRKLLVTGGAGFIGSNFVRHWRAGHPGEPITVMDLLTYAGNPANLDGVDGVELLQIDIADADAVSEAVGRISPTAIVHFAAESHNSLAVLEPSRFFRTNVIGTQSLLEAARQHEVERFHHVSTCEVYGDMDLEELTAFTEESPYRPRTPYSASKAAADHAVRAYHLTYGLNVTITNCANNYGPYQFPEKLIPLFASRALDNRPLPMYSNTTYRREWLHVSDHCRAIELVLEQGQPGRTYHVGSGVEASIEEIADLVLAATGRGSDLKEIVPERPGHDRRYLLDSSRLRRELGFSPEVEFEEGLAATVKWYAENRDWWQPLLGRSPVDEGKWGARSR
jgi:dTDP-glucose 4,6-dehydratase